MDVKYSLLEINDKNSTRKFLNFPSELYKGEKNWIRPLDDDIEKIFDPKRNKSFRKGKAIRWIVLDESKTVVGRVAAFYGQKAEVKYNQPTGGLGFFDCIDNQQVANILFDASRDWLRTEGLEAMEGPINFGSRDSFWGCLVDGFYEPLYNMPYNYKYYNYLFTNYGFKNYFFQYTYHLILKVGNLKPAIAEKAERLLRNPDYSIRIYEKKNRDKYALDFMEIFNKAWAKFPGVQPIRKASAIALFSSLKSIIDPQLLIYVYHKDKPVAFFIMIPDLFQIIRKFNGRFHFINKLRLVYNVKVKKTCTRAIGLIFGVIPEFQGKGVAEAMVKFFEDEVGEGMRLTDLEMNWIGDFNPSMMKLAEQVGGSIRKTHITYRYLFDRNKEFKRAKSI